MDLLGQLKKHYPYRNVEFINDNVIKTEHGRKRVQAWVDEQLLDWHVHWRDHCFSSPFVLTNRMIRTNEGTAAIRWKECWITLHDELGTPFPQKSYEKQWGKLLGKMLQYGISTEKKLQEDNEASINMDELAPLLRKFPNEKRRVLTPYFEEGQKRLNMAGQIKAFYQKEPLPLLQPDLTIKRGRKVHDVLVWCGDFGKPMRGYRPVRAFLQTWLEKNGEQSLQKLFSEMNLQFDLRGNQGFLLMAECLQPMELLPFFHTLEGEQTIDDIDDCFENMRPMWEQSRQLVEQLSKWMDEAKKKVGTS
ncbi:hypothetical protein [Halalkalibacterium ligniniphilum]|uniref:hypothetical protein n=1 Tax=Halalkalibacterium ligniniphilum TaxID=1134413 RepID=UPI00034DE3BC|nr:hypothetical protein [Halalkalibacterium ligniniphilum]